MIYDFKCKNCENEFEAERLMKDRNVPSNCLLCGYEAVRVPFSFSGGVTVIGTARNSRIPGMCHSIDPDKSVYIKNKAQLREECKTRGLYPAGL